MPVECRLANAEEWDAMVRLSLGSSFFHTRNWIKIWEDIIPGSKAICYYFCFDDGQKIIVPGLQRKIFKNLLIRFDTSVEGTYGGLLSTDRIDKPKHEYVQLFLKNKGSYFLRQNESENTGNYDSYQTIENTFVVQLDNWKENQKNYSQSIHDNMAKALKNGIIVKESNNTEDWTSYIGLYKESAVRWNKSIQTLYPDELFEKIRLINVDSRKLWLAYYNNVVVYGCLVFYQNTTAYYWHGAGNKLALENGVPSLIHDNIIRHLKIAGFLKYDMMPNGGKMSLSDFKSRFKPELVPVYGVNYKTMPYKIIEKLSRWKHSWIK